MAGGADPAGSKARFPRRWRDALCSADGEGDTASTGRALAALTCASCGRGSPADAAFCAGCGAKLGATATAREARKTVTALFCDLVGSTSLGERHDPEVLRPLLDRYFAEAREAV